MSRRITQPTLYVCCPAYCLRGPAQRAEILRRAQHLAKLCGWHVISGPSLTYYAGVGAWAPFEVRRAELFAALTHDYLWVCRGGYGCLSLLPDLLSLDLPGPPPILIGFSDVTVLHAAWKKRGWGETYYGSLRSGTECGRTAESLLPLLAGKGLARSSVTDPMVRVIRSGRAEGPTFAACLSVLAGLCGTPGQPDLRGSLLALEDVDERPYRVDFYLEQLFQAGALDGVRGLIGGGFLHRNEPEYQGPIHDEILSGWAERLNVPAITRLPFGHLTDPLALPNGRDALLEVAEASWRLTWRPRRLCRARSTLVASP